jgi:glutathione S-transferase
MKLYTYPGAPNPRRVHIFLAEKGIEIPAETVDIVKRDNRTPEFMERVNAMGGLPVLELDDGSHLAESVAICRYLEELHPEPPLFGLDAADRGRVEMWIRRIELNFMMPVGMVWVHGSPLTRAVVANQIAEVADQNREVVRRYFSFLDHRLADNRFLTGERFTMPDILCLCTLDFAAGLNKLPHDAAKHPNLERWAQDVKTRPSVAN